MSITINGTTGIVDDSGNILLGTTTNTNNSRIVSNGVIESTSGGIRFPNGTTQTTAASPLTTTNVLNATAGASLDAVGTYALLYNTAALSTIYLPGETAPGSVFYYTGSNGSTQSNTIPAGTWRCMGFTNIANSAARSTIWLRIS